MLEAFALIPVLEFLFKPNETNLSPEVKEKRVSDSFYKFVLRLCVPIQLAMGYTLLVQTQGDMDTTTLVGRILSYGMLCGVMGINVAHELGHKQNKADQFFSKILLTTTLYVTLFSRTQLWAPQTCGYQRRSFYGASRRVGLCVLV